MNMHRLVFVRVEQHDDAQVFIELWHDGLAIPKYISDPGAMAKLAVRMKNPSQLLSKLRGALR